MSTLGVLDTRPLSELRLNDTEFAQFRKDAPPSSTYKSLVDQQSPRLKVIGFNEDTKNVLKLSNPQGEDYVEVPWSSMDSILWIAQRLEDIIHVSLHHFFLATDDGVVFKGFGELVCTVNAFKSRDQIVLTLLTHADMPTYMSSNLKTHSWWHLESDTTDSLDPLEKCNAEFHLIQPEKSKDWSAYLEQRKKAVEGFESELSQFVGEDLSAFHEHIDKGVCAALAVTDLEEDEQSVLHDTVVPLSVDGSDDGWGNVSQFDVLSRIYSPTRPKSVDVYLEYYYRTRYSSVEFFCNVWYRASTKMTPDLKTNIPRGPRAMNGFRSLVSLGLEDVPPGRRWRAIDESEWNLSPDQLRGLHALLYGTGSNGVAEKISHLALVRLLLGSVGFVLDIAEHDGEEDEQIQVAELRWEGTDKSARWLGSNIRRVCGISALEQDAHDTDNEVEEDDDEEYSDEEYDPRGRDGCSYQ
ncbi:uncharacterized protein EV420DRAFT_1641683 [Desarmillaria tabescens]|uniref:Uncharacterized protein n=1 Tax=Armillaria tabescens TaxID=1929756 RepID=A0AA39KGU4_ARMTA|nr:uncharacterized protein EV420DRAFT_1641683 [Desarmillaria tabescens]KAK0459474.1 hypothetical protein EV420DRAFT_1641683 [Desarmillaria tabescens]